MERSRGQGLIFSPKIRIGNGSQRWLPFLCVLAFEINRQIFCRFKRIAYFCSVNSLDHGVGSTDHFSALKIWMFENKFVDTMGHWTQWGLALLCHFSLFSLECLLFEKVFVNLQPKETKL